LFSSVNYNITGNE